MYYFHAIIVPPSTLESEPLVYPIDLAMGVIEFIDIEIPLGCQGLTRVKITCHTETILPFNPTGWLLGNDRIFKVPLYYPLDTPPYRVQAILWNEDDTYSHSIQVGVMLNISTGDKIAILEGNG